MKVVIKSLAYTVWPIVFFVMALVSRSTLSIIVLGIFGILYSFGFGLAKQIIDEEEDL